MVGVTLHERLKAAERELFDAQRKVLILSTIANVLQVPDTSPKRAEIIEILESALTGSREKWLSLAALKMLEMPSVGDDRGNSFHYRGIGRALACRLSGSR